MLCSVGTLHYFTPPHTIYWVGQGATLASSDTMCPGLLYQGIPWVYPGIPGYTRVYPGYTRVYQGTPGYTRVYQGIPWYTLVYPGVPWYTLVYPGYTLVYPGIPGYTQGIPWYSNPGHMVSELAKVAPCPTQYMVWGGVK